MKATKKNFEEYLNNLSPKQGSDEWIIGGKIRMAYMWQEKYGSALRKFDPITFEVGFNEFKRKQS